MNSGEKAESCGKPFFKKSHDPFFSPSASDDVSSRRKSKEVVGNNTIEQRHPPRQRQRPRKLHSEGKTFGSDRSRTHRPNSSLPCGTLHPKEPLNLSLGAPPSEEEGHSVKPSYDQGLDGGMDASEACMSSSECGRNALQPLLPQEEEHSLVLEKDKSSEQPLCMGEIVLEGSGECVSRFSDMCDDDGKTHLEVCLPINILNKKEERILQRDTHPMSQEISSNRELADEKVEKEKYNLMNDILHNESPPNNSEKGEATPTHAVSSIVCVTTAPEEEEEEEGEVRLSCEVQQEQKQQEEERLITPLTIENPKLLWRADNYCHHYYRHRGYSFTPEVNLALCQLVEEYVLASLTQKVEEMMPHRRAELRCVAECLTKVISHVASCRGLYYNALRYYVFGSVAMCTLLPDSDNDMTIDIDGLLDATKNNVRDETTADSNPFDAANTNDSTNNGLLPPQAAAIAGGELLSDMADYLRQQNMSLYVDALVVAEVRVLKLVKDGYCYDITAGQLGGVDCVRFLQELDMEIGCNHLLKRTIMLLRAWCCYEAHVLSGQGGYMSSYAATIMLVAMMNTVEFLEDVEQGKGEDAKGEEEENGEESEYYYCNVFKDVSPFQLFARFLKFFSYFDFEHYCVTVFGPLPCSSLTGKFLDLSRLEVSVAHKNIHGDLSKSVGAGLEEDDFGLPIDVNNLGLTAEGQAVLGPCIRRRAKPLVTVSGVKHILHDEQLRRQRGRMNLNEVRQKGDEINLRRNNIEDNDLNRKRPRINRRGCAVEDMSLSCSSCNTRNYSLRTMNVMDPLRWSASLCRGVCRNHLQRIRRAFREGLALFEMASTRLISETSPSFVSNEGGDAGAANLTNACHTVRTLSDTVNGNRTRFSSLSPIKKSVLQDLFGQTLKKLRRHSAVLRCLSPQPQPVRCGQCPKSSFFCLRSGRQVCEPQFVFDFAKKSEGELDEHVLDWSRMRELHVDAQNSSLAPTTLQQHQIKHPYQKQQQQLNMVTSSVSMVPAPGSSIISAVSHSDSPQFMDYLRGGDWTGVGQHTHRDPSMASMNAPPHFARGAPLLRPTAKGGGGPWGKRAAHTALPANGKFSFSPGQNPFSSHSSHSAAGTPVLNCKTSIKHSELDGTSVDLPPPSLSSLNDAHVHVPTASHKR